MRTAPVIQATEAAFPGGCQGAPEGAADRANHGFMIPTAADSAIHDSAPPLYGESDGLGALGVMSRDCGRTSAVVDRARECEGHLQGVRKLQGGELQAKAAPHPGDLGAGGAFLLNVIQFSRCGHVVSPLHRWVGAAGRQSSLPTPASACSVRHKNLVMQLAEPIPEGVQVFQRLLSRQFGRDVIAMEVRGTCQDDQVLRFLLGADTEDRQGATRYWGSTEPHYDGSVNLDRFAQVIGSHVREPTPAACRCQGAAVA